MAEKISQFKARYLYSEETHGVLNLLSLDIKDREIAKEYELYRSKRFRGLYWPLFVYVIVLTIFGWTQYFFGNGEIAEAVRPLHLQIDLLILSVFHFSSKKGRAYCWILL